MSEDTEEIDRGLLDKAMTALVNLTESEKAEHGVLDMVGRMREALTEEFARRNERVSVREFFPDEEQVVFRVSGPNTDSQLMRVGVSREDGGFSFGEPEEVRATTQFEPVEGASEPSWSGKDAQGSWSAPSLTDILRGRDIADPDTSWDDLSRSQQSRVEDHFLEVPQGGADNFSDLGFPVVTAEGELSRRGLISAKQRASQFNDDDIFRMADRLLTDEFETEKVLERVPSVPMREGSGGLLFVASSPSEVDVVRGEGLTGPAGATFKEHYLSVLGVEKSEVSVTHLVPELLTRDDGGARQPTEAEIHSFRDAFWADVERAGPGRIIALGSQAREALGPVADEALPHPHAVRAHGDSGEIRRKLERVSKSDPVSVRKEVLDPTDLPVGPNKAFRKQPAVGRIRRWASSDGSGDKGTIDFDRYEQAFLVRSGAPTNLTSYRLPVADVIDGELHLMPAAVRKARRDLRSTMLPSTDQGEARRVADQLLDRVESADKSLRGELVKSDEEKQVAYYVVYPSDEVDAHGEWASQEELERAAHDFLSEMRHVGKHHESLDDGEVVESYIAPTDFTMGGEQVHEGDWVGAVRWGDEAWEEVKAGVTPAISMGGAARRVPDSEPPA